MSTIGGSVGIISGLPIGELVERLLTAQQRPITQIDDRIKGIASLRTALLDISARLLALKSKGAALGDADFFRAVSATSSQDTVLRATASAASAPGEYGFTVRQLASTHQLYGNGFATADRTYLSAGTLTIETASARLDRGAALGLLRGGEGVRGGVVRVTDRAGASTEIDLTTARSVDDVVTAFNSQSRVAVRARVQGDAIVIQDTSNATAGPLTIVDVGIGHAAADLGIAGSSGSGVLTGGDLVALSAGLRLDVLNDGNGVRRSRVGADFRVSLSDGSTLDVDLTGRLSTTTSLAVVNGGAGVATGPIRLLNRAGQSTTVDLTGAVSIGDVLNAINNSGAGITASIVGSSIVLADSTTGAASTQVAEVGAGTTARDLGLTSTSTSGTITGASIHRIETIGDVLNAINRDAANLGRVSAAISADGDALVLNDRTTGSGSLQVSALNGSSAAADLGLLGDSGGRVLRSGRLLSGLDSVLLRSLRGGQGIETGLLQIIDRAGVSAQIDISGASSLAEVIDAINTAGTGVRVSISDSGLGLVATDTSGGTGSLLIKDESGRAAEQLGIAYSGSGSVVRGGNLQRQYVSESTRLDQFDAGRGVQRGRFRIANSAGVSAVIDLSQGDELTLRDVIAEINSRGIGVTARINDNGDGILLTDAAGGAGRLTVTEDGGGTARSLRLLGVAAEGSVSIDGSLETRINVGPNDTLQTVLARVQSAGANVNAAILNDGSQLGPYHLTLTSARSGVVGRLAVDGGATGLAFSTLARGRDAIVQVGGEDGGAVLASATNTLVDAFPGGSIELISASNSPVTVSVTRDVAGITKRLSEFADAYNAILARINELSTFNAETGARGILLGDRSAQQVRERLTRLLTNEVSGQPSNLSRLSSVGFSFSNGRLSFNSEKFEAAYNANPEGVARLFGQETSGLADRIETEIDALAGSTDGLLTRRGDTLDQTTESLKRRKTDLQSLLSSRRARLTAQFQVTETVIARLQSQQSALSAIVSANSSLSAG